MKFLIDRTYTEITPESAAEGVPSETGFVFEDQEFTLDELKEYIKDEGLHREPGTRWYTTGTWTDDYTTATEREECIHIRMMV